MKIWNYLSSWWIKPLFYYDRPLSVYGYIFCLTVFFFLFNMWYSNTNVLWMMFVHSSVSFTMLQSVCWQGLWLSQGSVGGSFQEPSGGFTDCWPLTLAPSHMDFSMRAAWNTASVMASLVISCSEWSHLQCCKLSWRNWDLLTATWVGLEISLSSCPAAWLQPSEPVHLDKPCHLSQRNVCWLKLLHSGGNLYYADIDN